MPTGYTSDVADGKITDFKTYALQCARAFGACIMLRDEPMSDDIPEFEPSDHHKKALEDAQRNLSEFNAMSDEEKVSLFEKETAKRIEQAQEGIARNQQQLDRYSKMLKHAKAFKAPTPEHAEYAKFLVSQLEESIRFDCGDDYWQQRLEEKLTFDEWCDSKMESIVKDIKYHRQHLKEEIERTKSRNKWVADLKKSLGVE